MKFAIKIQTLHYIAHNRYYSIFISTQKLKRESTIAIRFHLISNILFESDSSFVTFYDFISFSFFDANKYRQKKLKLCQLVFYHKKTSFFDTSIYHKQVYFPLIFITHSLQHVFKVLSLESFTKLIIKQKNKS